MQITLAGFVVGTLIPFAAIVICSYVMGVV